jgi:hypothetical protein
MKAYLTELGHYAYQKIIEWLSPLALKLLAQPGAAGLAHKLNLQKQYRIEIGHPDRVAILLVGVGGTGGHVAPILAQLAAWATDQGLDLRLYFIDPDVVEPKNLGRQNFCAAEVGYPKAFTLACNVSGACRRLENGGGDFSCGSGASCSANTPTTGGVFEPRVIIVDELRGIAAGLTIFDFQTTGHLDLHMMKMSGGEVHAVHAILRDTDGESGWD